MLLPLREMRKVTRMMIRRLNKIAIQTEAISRGWTVWSSREKRWMWEKGWAVEVVSNGGGAVGNGGWEGEWE